jgi:acyl carrier protein
MYRCSGTETEPPPIGRPIANAKIYILDKYLQPAPINVPAELHVAGVSLAAGYRNQPGMTAEKFIENPFNPEHSQSFQRLYKTGDLARYRADGNIEFLGRIDQQVKVRGFRIELGEIESALSKHPLVEETAVIVQDTTRLVAFVSLRSTAGKSERSDEIGAQGGDKKPDVSDLRNFLRQSLPEYMLPSAFVFLDEFPLSPSGKIDRKALAALKAVERPDLESVYTAPRNPTEQRLVQISSDLLHLEKVGVYDNFFELGGHSLLATQFVSRVRDEFGVELPLRKVFENPTIAGIATAIDDARGMDNAPGETVQASTSAKSNKAADRAKLLEMLQRIGELSDDEVKTLLELKRRSED